VGLCDALASLWGARAGAFAPVQAAAAICHGGLLTGQAAAALGTTPRCFPEITRWVSVLQPAFSAGPLSLAQIAGLLRSGLERDDSAKQIAHVLRLEPEEWQAMCYRHIGGRNRFDQG